MAISQDTILFIKFFCVFSIIVSINTYKEIKTFRLIQYENNEQLYGSQYSNLNYIGSYYKADCLRKIALVPLVDIQEIFEIENVLKGNANAVLFILPNSLESLQKLKEILEKAQIIMTEKTFYLPVYFSYENDELNSIVSQLKEEYLSTSTSETTENKGILNSLGINQNLLHFSLSTNEPKKIDSLNLENFYGFLEGVNSGSANPIIAIVSHYDTLNISPDLPTGINTNGSGVVALLELVRILSKFYENYDNVLKYDLLFVLTSAGTLNFQGTSQLLNNLEPNILENIQFVLCLDSLASLDEKDLFLHISRFPKEQEESALRFYKIMNTTSENMNFNLNFVKKRIYLNSKYVPWEHEQFSKKKILAATLSGIKAPSSNIFNRTHLLDTSIDKNTLKRNIKFLSESLLSFLFDYDIKNFTIFKDDENLLDENNLDSLTSYLKKISRFNTNIQKNSQFNNDLFSFFSSYLQKPARQNFEYKNMTFYDSNNGNIRIYSVKSKMIDLYLLLVIMVYLFFVYLYTKGVKNFVKSMKATFNNDADD